MTQYLKISLLSFGLSLALTPLARKLAFRFNILDHPKSRKIHAEPVPRLGGLAIYLAFLIAIIINLDFNRKLVGVILGGTIIFLVGIVDDIKHLSAKFKLSAQLLASF